MQCHAVSFISATCSSTMLLRWGRNGREYESEWQSFQVRCGARLGCGRSAALGSGFPRHCKKVQHLRVRPCPPRAIVN